jgi:enhancer of polycomb-like protein
MMDRLEKSCGQTVLSLVEAKALLKEDDELIDAVYDYWLTKRLHTVKSAKLATWLILTLCSLQLTPLIPQVKTESRLPGMATNNPYLAFRRRTEKMQTRKNRKNDEASYEKMLKLRRDLYRAITLLELVKRREKHKRENLHLAIDIYEKRYILTFCNLWKHLNVMLVVTWISVQLYSKKL